MRLGLTLFLYYADFEQSGFLAERAAIAEFEDVGHAIKPNKK
jgi:hypothetical protein